MIPRQSLDNQTGFPDMHEGAKHKRAVAGCVAYLDYKEQKQINRELRELRKFPNCFGRFLLQIFVVICSIHFFRDSRYLSDVQTFQTSHWMRYGSTP